MNPCYTTRSGLKIGCAYVPPPSRIVGDAVTLQSALLSPATARPQSALRRILGRVWQWL